MREMASLSLHSPVLSTLEPSWHGLYEGGTRRLEKDKARGQDEGSGKGLALYAWSPEFDLPEPRLKEVRPGTTVHACDPCSGRHRQLDPWISPAGQPAWPAGWVLGWWGRRWANKPQRYLRNNSQGCPLAPHMHTHTKTENGWWGGLNWYQFSDLEQTSQGPYLKNMKMLWSKGKWVFVFMFGSKWRTETSPRRWEISSS